MPLGPKVDLTRSVIAIAPTKDACSSRTVRIDVLMMSRLSDALQASTAELLLLSSTPAVLAGDTALLADAHHAGVLAPVLCGSLL
jgi:hypothetical protein